MCAQFVNGQSRYKPWAKLTSRIQRSFKHVFPPVLSCLIPCCHTETAVPEGAVELRDLVYHRRYGLCRCCGQQLMLLWHLIPAPRAASPMLLQAASSCGSNCPPGDGAVTSIPVAKWASIPARPGSKLHARVSPRWQGATAYLLPLVCPLLLDPGRSQRDSSHHPASGRWQLPDISSQRLPFRVDSFRKPVHCHYLSLTQRFLRFKRSVMGYQRILAASLACLDIRGCASIGARVLVMSCTWSLSVQHWQTCVAVFQMFLRHIRRCSSSCGSHICCRLPDF